MTTKKRARAPFAKSARTRARILDSAARVFSKSGYAATRLTDIAEAADVKQGSLYYYFDSKDTLVAEMLRVGLQRPTSMSSQPLTHLARMRLRPRVLPRRFTPTPKRLSRLSTTPRQTLELSASFPTKSAPATSALTSGPTASSGTDCCATPATPARLGTISTYRP